MAQVKAKVGREARERMDREADAKLHELEGAIRRRTCSAPLERFALAAEPVDMSTTDERAVMRLRMAGEQQLAAHTPRPSAPSDSLASLQLHESALNNAIRGLGLDGRRMTVGELHALLRAKFTRRAASAAGRPAAAGDRRVRRSRRRARRLPRRLRRADAAASSSCARAATASATSASTPSSAR